MLECKTQPNVISDSQNKSYMLMYNTITGVTFLSCTILRKYERIHSHKHLESTPICSIFSLNEKGNV